jgi:hypothetical protein
MRTFSNRVKVPEPREEEMSSIFLSVTTLPPSSTAFALKYEKLEKFHQFQDKIKQKANISDSLSLKYEWNNNNFDLNNGKISLFIFLTTSLTFSYPDEDWSLFSIRVEDNQFSALREIPIQIILNTNPPKLPQLAPREFRHLSFQSSNLIVVQSV